jgi:hypothetical protein
MNWVLIPDLLGCSKKYRSFYPEPVIPLFALQPALLNVTIEKSEKTEILNKSFITINTERHILEGSHNSE